MLAKLKIRYWEMNINFSNLYRISAMLKDGDESVRKSAMNAIARLYKEVPYYIGNPMMFHAGPQILRIVMNALDDRDSTVRRLAMNEIESLPIDHGNRYSLLIEVLRKPDSDVRGWATKEMAKLAKIVVNDSSYWIVPSWAWTALKRIDEVQMLQLLIMSYRSQDEEDHRNPNWTDSDYANDNLPPLGPPERKSSLSSENSSERERALTKIWWGENKQAAAFEQCVIGSIMLKDVENGVRSSALQVLKDGVRHLIRQNQKEMKPERMNRTILLLDSMLNDQSNPMDLKIENEVKTLMADLTCEVKKDGP